MKSTRILPSIVALLFATTSSPATVLIGPVSNPANSHYYYLIDTTDWINSENEALTLGGHLVTVNDQAENDWVYSTFSDGGTRSLWNGLNDSVVEGTFEWVSGESVTYTNFFAGEPNNNGNEDYVHWFEPFHGNKWNDVQNSGIIAGSTYGVVESVPEPSTALLGAIGILALGFRRIRNARNA